MDQDRPDPEFEAMTSRLLRRETLRRAAEKLNTTTGPGREEVLAPISAEVTTEAASRVSATNADPYSWPDGSAPDRPVLAVDAGIGEDTPAAALAIRDVRWSSMKAKRLLLSASPRL
jgi:hypothetical protein